MAVQTTTTLVDDIDGTEAYDTVTFALDGIAYEIDLSEENISKLLTAVSAYIAAARRVGGPGRGRQPRLVATPFVKVAPNRDQATAVRHWARSQGLKVSDRGRISRSIVEQFEAAH